MTMTRDAIDGYIKRVKELAEHVSGNEQATKQSLIGPFFTMLGYDLTDPRECLPEYKADFGKDRSSKPIDWGFKHNGAFAFFVEAKAVGKKLASYDEQLADYFAKDPNVKLGVLTNGTQWRFFTDVVNPNVMDKEPFATWDIVADEPAPLDVLTLLQKSKFNAELIRAYAQRQRAQNLLLSELTRLLEPSSEFTKLAVANLETRNLTAAVVDSWKPIVANAVNEWARQRTLSGVLAVPVSSGPSAAADETATKVHTSPAELEAFEAIKRLLGPDRPVAYEDSQAYFKIHLAEKRTWVCARLQLDRKVPLVWVPLSPEQVTPMARGLPVNSSQGWTSLALDSAARVADLKDVLLAAYATTRQTRVGGERRPLAVARMVAMRPWAPAVAQEVESLLGYPGGRDAAQASACRRHGDMASWSPVAVVFLGFAKLISSAASRHSDLRFIDSKTHLRAALPGQAWGAT